MSAHSYIGARLVDAFGALVAGDKQAARRHLALAQTAHFGMKPYKHGAPELDAAGNRIVYQEGGWRFTVHLVQPDGSHVRHLVTGDRGKRGRFMVVARSELQQGALAIAFATLFNLHGVRQDGAHYEYGRSLD